MGSAVATRPELLVFDEARAGSDYISEVPQGLDSPKHTSLIAITTKIGELLQQQAQTEAELKQEAPYVVTDEDIEKLGRKALKHGLYIYSDDPRHANARELVTLKSRESEDIAKDAKLHLPFEAHGKDQPGVVFPAAEFTKVGKHPGQLIRNAQARTQNKNAGSGDRDQERKNVDKSARGIMRTYIETMDAQDAKYLQDLVVAKKLFRQTNETKVPQCQYRTDNFVRDIVHMDSLFRTTLEVAAINNEWGNQAVIGANHALNKLLYSRDNPIHNRIGWRVMLETCGQYVHAKRFKLLQARANCENYLTLHAKDPEED